MASLRGQGDDLFRLGFADPLTGACRPGLAENSPPDCFPGAAALLKGKAGVTTSQSASKDADSSPERGAKAAAFD